MKQKKPVLLAILDGWGQGQQNESNAVFVGKTPNMDKWQRENPFTTLVAHNGEVGLPDGQMGNSEVGHLNIGAGRIVYQDFTKINLAIENGDFFDHSLLISVIRDAKAKGSSLHLFGLLSDGGVHSHINHLIALIKMAAKEKLEKVYIHAFMDGRDTPPTSGADYIKQLQAAMDEIGVGQIATISGRFYAMDRDNRWQRVEKAWQALVAGEGVAASEPVAAVEEAYGKDETDEFIKPIVLNGKNGEPIGRIQNEDAIISFNFRADRVRQLTKAFTDNEFNDFDVTNRPSLSNYVTFTEYEKDFDLPVVFPPQAMQRILGEEVSNAGLKQLRIAETEKYAHVTYFLNGGKEEPYENEDRVLIPSPQEVATYDQKPEMSAFLVTEKLLEKISSDKYDLIVLNFANGDMVGHSGILEAAAKACEAVDQCLGKIVGAVQDKGGVVLITADHGNAEIMEDPSTEEAYTAHSLNPVPFILISDGYKGKKLRQGGSLKDIAPTILRLLNLPVPPQMEGESLILD